MSRSVPFLLLALALAAGCDRETAAEAPDLRGVYTLQRTDVGPVPVVLGSREGCTYTAAAGHVVLFDSVSYEAALIRERKCEGEAAPPDTVFTDEGRGRYVVEGDSLRFEFAQGATSGFGSFKGDTLVVRGTGQTMYYLRDEQMTQQILQTDTAR